MVQRFLEVAQLVSHQSRLSLVEAIWEGVAEELRDLQVAGDQEWAEEGAPHLHTAIQKLMEGLWIHAENLTNNTTNMELEGREP